MASARAAGQRVRRRFVGAIEPRTVQHWRQRLLRRACDDTRASGERSCLVVAPHPDDETFGCGALLARKCANGVPVNVVVLTDGALSHPRAEVTALAARRRGELFAACAVLGIPPDRVHLLGYRDRSLAHHVDEVASDLTRLITRFKPDDVLVTSSMDGHPDHQAASLAARRAVLAVANARLVEYPVWYWYRGPFTERGGVRQWRALWAMRQLVRPPQGQRVDAAAYLRRKSAALSAYASQLTDLEGDGSWQTMPHGFVECFLGPFEIFFPTVHGPTDTRS